MNSRHPDPRRMWKVGPRAHFPDQFRKICRANNETSFFDNPYGKFDTFSWKMVTPNWKNTCEIGLGSTGTTKKSQRADLSILLKGSSKVEAFSFENPRTTRAAPRAFLPRSPFCVRV